VQQWITRDVLPSRSNGRMTISIGKEFLDKSKNGK
jgi:hypothetical protein